MNEPAFPPGFEYPRWEIKLSASEQAEKLECCDIDPAIYNGRVDLTHLAAEAIMATKRAGGSINGGVHVLQTFSLSEPIAIGEPVEIRGHVASVEPHPRGSYSTLHFDFFRPDGSCPLRTTRGSLKLDPNAKSGEAKSLDGTVRNEPEFELVLRSEHQLVPEKVAEFTVEAENLIHSDPEVAREFGFRAPIAGGLFGVRLMMAHLARAGEIRRLEMQVRFKRPMFWDDCLKLYANGELHRTGGQMELRRADGKVACVASVTDIEIVA